MPSLTPLAVAALGLLNEQPMHPYEMFQTMISRDDDRHVKVRPGTLYHQVAKLVDLGYSEVVGTDRAGNRPERTTYAITDAGRAVLVETIREMLAEPAEEYPQFPLALAEIENLSATEAAQALEERVAALEEFQASQLQIIAEFQAKGLPERYKLDADYMRAMTDAQLAWIRTAEERIRSGGIPWSETDHPQLDTKGAAQ